MEHRLLQDLRRWDGALCYARMLCSSARYARSQVPPGNAVLEDLPLFGAGGRSSRFALPGGRLVTRRMVSEVTEKVYTVKAPKISQVGVHLIENNFS
jgi:hypothetical protein